METAKAGSIVEALGSNVATSPKLDMEGQTETLVLKLEDIEEVVIVEDNILEFEDKDCSILKKKFREHDGLAGCFMDVDLDENALLSPENKENISQELKKMSRKDLEDLVMVKVVEGIVKHSEAGQFRARVLELHTQKDKMFQRVGHLQKQVQELSKALKLLLDNQSRDPNNLNPNKRRPPPIKFYRSVGLQVMIEPAFRNGSIKVIHVNSNGLVNGVNRGLNAVAPKPANASASATSGFTVHELNSKAHIVEVSQYPVLSRCGDLVFYGPVNKNAFTFSKPAAFNVILHVPGSSKMFSMCRSENKAKAERIYNLYRGTFPLLVLCDSTICDATGLERMAKQLRENPGWTAPHIAAFNSLQICLRHAKMKDRLNDRERNLLRTPLLVAIDNNNVRIVNLLLELGVDVSIKDIKENSVFHIASQKPPKIFQLLLDKVPLRDRELLNDINAEGCTPLHFACKSKNHELVKVLLGAGADEKIGSESQGFPTIPIPIHIAVKTNSVSSMQEHVQRNPVQRNINNSQTGATGGSHQDVDIITLT